MARAKITPIIPSRSVQPPIEPLEEELAPIAIPKVELPTTDVFSLLAELYPEYGTTRWQSPTEADKILGLLITQSQEDPDAFLQDLFERDTVKGKQLLELLGSPPEEIAALSTQQVAIEDTIIAVFPTLTSEDFFDLITTDFNSFVAEMQGFTEEKATLLSELGYTKSEIDSFYGIGTPQVTGGIPLFDAWVDEKGFAPTTFADDLRARGVAEELIPEMVEFQMSELRSVYEYEHNFGRWGTALGELDKIFISEPEKILGVAKVFGQTLLKLPRQLGAAVLTAAQGQGGASVVDKDWTDRFIEGAQEDLDKFMTDIAKQYPNSQLMSELSSLSQNLAFSVTAMGAGLAVGVPVALAPVPGARVLAYTSGTAASGFVAYQMTTYQIMQQYLELMDADKQTEFGIGLTQFEEDELKKEFHSLAVKYGLWEAIPEAISNLAFFSILTAPLTSMVGRSVATRLISKIAGIYGEELITEMITQKGQARIEVEAGLRELDIGWVEAFKEIAPQTFLLTTVMAGAGSTIISVNNRIKKAKQSLTNEIGENHPQHEELIEKIENNLDEAVTTEPVAEEVPAVPEVTELEKHYAYPFDTLEEKAVSIRSAIEQGKIEPSQFDDILYDKAPPQRMIVTGQKKVLSIEEKKASLLKEGTELPLVEVAKPSVVAKPPVKKTIQEEIGEAIPPDEPVSTTMIPNTQGMGGVGALEKYVRMPRRTFIKLGQWRNFFKPAQEAEVLVHEEGQQLEKQTSELRKMAGKDKARWELIANEVDEGGSVVGLTFNEKRVVTKYRAWADKWADRKNLPKEKRIKDYMPHLFEQEATRQIKEEGGVDPVLAKILSERATKKITDPFLKERLGAVGWIKDPFAAMDAYNAVALKVYYYTPLLNKIDAILANPDVLQAEKNYWSEYSRRMTGEWSEFDKAANVHVRDFAEFIKDKPVIGKWLYPRLTQGNPAGAMTYHMTGTLYLMYLGFKATSAIRNLSQHLLILGEVGPKHFAMGIALRTDKTAMAARDKGLVYRSRKFAYTAGIDATFVNQASDTVRETGMFMFRRVDKTNVTTAFLAGYSESREALIEANNRTPTERKWSQERLEQAFIDRGDEVDADTQYIYTKLNSMPIAQSAIGRPVSMLVTWTNNWIELMIKWAKRSESQVYKEFERETGTKLRKKNWSNTYKAMILYAAVVGAAFAFDDKTPIKLKEYTGIGSLRYLAGSISGEFPFLEAYGATAKVVAGWATDDERMLNNGLYELKSSFTPGIIKQLDDVSSGDKDWVNLFLYTEGKHWKILQLKEDWEKGWKEYEGLVAKERTQYRVDSPLIEAQRFIAGKFTTLSSDKARAEVLRLIEKHNINPDLISGYNKIFGVDIKSELQKFEKRIGNLEKLEIGEEAEYFTTSNYVSEINRLVKKHGLVAVADGASPLTKFILGEQTSLELYDDYETEGKILLRQQNPELEASLYLFGKIMAFENPNSALALLNLMDKYDIPPEAIKAFVNDPTKYDELLTPLFELKRKWFELTTEFEVLEGDERDAFETEHPDWVKGIRRIEAYDKDIPETHHDGYVEYYTLPVEGYDQERFLQDNEAYYNDVWLGILGNQEKDFNKIPTVKFEETLTEYEGLDLGRARYDFRGENPWFDEEGVRLGKWKPYEKPTTGVAGGDKRLVHGWYLTEPITAPLEELMSNVWDASNEDEAYKWIYKAVGQYGQWDVKAALEQHSTGDLQRYFWDVRLSDAKRHGVIPFLVGYGNEFWKVFDWLASGVAERYEGQLERTMREVPKFKEIVIDTLLPIYQGEPRNEFPIKTWNKILEMAVAEYGVNGIIDKVESMLVVHQWDRIKEEIRSMEKPTEVEGVRRKRITTGEFAETEAEFEEAMSKIEGLLEGLK